MTARSLSQVNREVLAVSGWRQGVQAGSSRTGKITLSGMNVIGLQACHQHMGPPTVSGLHREGQQRRIQTLHGIYRRVFGGEFVFGLFEFKKLCSCPTTPLSVALSCKGHVRSSWGLNLWCFASDSFSSVSYSVDGTTFLIRRSLRRWDKKTAEEDRKEEASGCRRDQTCQIYRVSFCD